MIVVVVVVVALSSWDFVKVVMIGGCHDGVSERGADLVEVQGCCCYFHYDCPCQASQQASHQMDHPFCFCCVRFRRQSRSPVKFEKITRCESSIPPARVLS